MNKKSYKSKEYKVIETPVTQDIPTPEAPSEGLSSGKGIGRGYVLPGEPTALYDEDPTPEVVKKPYLNKRRKIDSKDLLDIFVMLGDELDKQGEVSMANFADFMIKKVADQSNLDYSSLFKDLLVKIVDSDIMDKNDLILSLVEIFNRVLILNVNNNLSLEESKLEAYQAAVARAKRYVR